MVTDIKNNSIVNVGIVGLGRAGFSMQCDEIDAVSDRFKIVAGCDDFEPWRARMSKRYPSAAIYGRLEDMLKDPGIELVSIATRSVDHFRHSLQALKAGKDVLVEKPMCINYPEAVELHSVAAESGANLYVRHNRRFDPDFLHVKEIIESGVLGRIHTIKLCRAFFGPRKDWQALKEMGGGQLLNWGPHIIDHALQFLDAPEHEIKDVWSCCQRLISGGDCEDHIKVILKGFDNCIVDVEISSAAALAEPEYIVWGTRGALSLALEDSKINIKPVFPK